MVLVLGYSAILAQVESSRGLLRHLPAFAKIVVVGEQCRPDVEVDMSSPTLLVFGNAIELADVQKHYHGERQTTSGKT